MTLDLNTLSPEDRRRLLRFVCSFAWADLEVTEEERAFLKDLIQRLRVPPEDAAEALCCLAHPPSPEDIDPLDVPHEHRQLFLDAAMEMMKADGEVQLGEMENYLLFRQLLP